MSPSLDITKAHETAAFKHGRPLIACRFDPTGKLVFVGTEDQSLQRYALEGGAHTPFDGGHETWIKCITFSNDGQFVISGACDGRLVWWEAAADKPQPIRTVEAHHGWIRSTCTSPDGEAMASAGNDLVIRIWSINNGEKLAELTGHKRDVYSIAFHPNGKTLLSGDLLGTVHEWDLQSGKSLRTFDAKQLHSYNGGQRVDFGGVRTLDVSPDEKTLSAGGLHKASNPLGSVHEPLALTFNCEDAKLIHSHVATGIDRGVIWRQRYLADGTLMSASGGGSGGFLLFFKPDSEKSIHQHKLPNTARDMDLHADGLQVATAHHSGHVRITRLAAKST